MLSFRKIEFDETNIGIATKVTDGFRKVLASYNRTNEITCPSQVANISHGYADQRGLHWNENDMKMKGLAWARRETLPGIAIGQRGDWAAFLFWPGL